MISGYVITSSLAGGRSENLLDFVTGFYERRIRRLAPALVAFVLITALLICVFNPDPSAALGLGWRSLFGFFNISLYQSSTDYFAQSSELNPLWVHQEFKRPIIFIIASVADPIAKFPARSKQIQRARAFRSAFQKILDHGNYLIVVAPNPKFFGIDQTVSDLCGGGIGTQFNPICNKEITFLHHHKRTSSSHILNSFINGHWRTKE